jgi:hypothetical protein
MQDKDEMVWGCSRDGNYSVNSAYYFIMDRSRNNSRLCKPGEWDKLWKLRISNKVKVFLWTALCGVLQTRSRLIQKDVLCRGNCAFCLGGLENEWHVFLWCDVAKEVWMEVGIWELIQPIVNEAEGFCEAIIHMLSNLSSEQIVF